MDKIIICDSVIYGCHGVNPGEKIKEQPFVIALEMDVDLSPAGKSDNLDDTVSYAAVNKLITKIITGKSFDLIERLAEEISMEILNTFDKVIQLKLCVKKPEAPMKGDFKWVGVEIERSRTTK
jgi:dihydroneopterin aldolase